LISNHSQHCKLANKQIAEEAEKLKNNAMPHANGISRIVSSVDVPKVGRDKFVYISAFINGTKNSLCDSGCDVNLLPVHFVNPCDVLFRECKLYAAGGTSIEVLGHCQITIQLENGFIVETDFVISPSIKKPMLGIDWLTKNAVRWNFLEGTFMI